jgi:hypothetical protein
VILVRDGRREGGTIMKYQHYEPAYTVPVQLDNGKWTAATWAEVEPHVPAS